MIRTCNSLGRCRYLFVKVLEIRQLAGVDALSKGKR